MDLHWRIMICGPPEYLHINIERFIYNNDKSLCCAQFVLCALSFVFLWCMQAWKWLREIFCSHSTMIRHCHCMATPKHPVHLSLGMDMSKLKPILSWVISSVSSLAPASFWLGAWTISRICFQCFFWWHMACWTGHVSCKCVPKARAGVQPSNFSIG